MDEVLYRESRGQSFISLPVGWFRTTDYITKILVTVSICMCRKRELEEKNLERRLWKMTNLRGTITSFPSGPVIGELWGEGESRSEERMNAIPEELTRFPECFTCSKLIKIHHGS